VLPEINHHKRKKKSETKERGVFSNFAPSSCARGTQQEEGLRSRDSPTPSLR